MGGSRGNEGNFSLMGVNGYEYWSPEVATRTKGAVFIFDVMVSCCASMWTDCGQREIKELTFMGRHCAFATQMQIGGADMEAGGG